MTFRRGFKSEVNNLVAEIRAELGIGPLERLDPWKLAKHLAIPIEPLSITGLGAQQAVDHLTKVNPEAFSAVTVFAGNRRIVIHNDSHVLGRQASNITHELAHGLLLHPPSPALDGLGCRRWDQLIEDEADWLAGVLLIPESVALHIARTGMSIEFAAKQYQVSKQMVRYRLNITGARIIISRARMKWGFYRPRASHNEQAVSRK